MLPAVFLYSFHTDVVNNFSRYLQRIPTTKFTQDDGIYTRGGGGSYSHLAANYVCGLLILEKHTLFVFINLLFEPITAQTLINN